MTMATKFTRADIAATCQNTVDAFLRCFERVPTPKEQEMLVSIIWRYFNEPDAPSTRLQ